MSKISANVVKFAKQKSIPALVMDVVGKTCTVVLSGRGKVLHNVPFIGPSPTVGDSVSVNYSTGRPLVEAGAKAIISTAPSATLSRPSPTPGETGRSSYHNDMKGLQGGSPADLSNPAEYHHLTAAQVAAIGGGEVEEAPINGIPYSREDGGWVASPSGLIAYSDDSVSNPPTQVEISAALGDPAVVGSGYSGLINDGGNSLKGYFVMSDSHYWWIVPLSRSFRTPSDASLVILALDHFTDGNGANL